MELHAWINPYRARMKSRIEPAPNHIVRTHPERVFEYDGLYVLNPGIPSNSDYSIIGKRMQYKENLKLKITGEKLTLRRTCRTWPCRWR